METFRGVVYNWECDMFDHMNTQYYQAKFDAATWFFIGKLGMTSEYFRSENRSLVVMEQRIRYHKELLAGDLVSVRSELLEVKDKSLKYRHLLYNDMSGELSAETVYSSVLIHSKTRSSTEFPPSIRAKLKVALEEYLVKDKG